MTTERRFESPEQRKAVMSKLANKGTKQQWKDFHDKDPKQKSKITEPIENTGWRKDQSPEIRHKRVLDSADERLSQQHKYKWAYHKMNSVAKKNGDSETARKARDDANHFLKLCHKNNGGK